jgi:hypothetical protein
MDPAIQSESACGLESRKITRVEDSARSASLRQGAKAILSMSVVGLSETQVWTGRAVQARRLAGMLSPGDAALLEAYAKECDDRVRASICKATDRPPLSERTRARNPEKAPGQAPRRKRAA